MSVATMSPHVWFYRQGHHLAVSEISCLKSLLMWACYVLGFIYCVCKWLVCFPELLLFFIVLYSIVLKANTEENKSTVGSLKTALVLHKAHSFGDIRSLLDIPKRVGKYMDVFSSGNPHLCLVELVFILFSEAITSRKKLPAPFLIHFPYIGFLKETKFK